jgi:DNA-binding transcriptional ArsR family regulator
MTDRMDAAVVLAPKVIEVDFTLAPALNVIDSMVNLQRAEMQTSFAEWVTKTVALLSPEVRKTNKLVFWGLTHLFYDRAAQYRDFKSFPAFLESFAAQDALKMRDQFVRGVISHHQKFIQRGLEVTAPTPEDLINDRAVYLDWVKNYYQEEEMDVEFEIEIHTLITNPNQMLTVATKHLRYMWETYMEKEWARVEPMLAASLSAFAKLDYSHMTVGEAVRLVTGREIPVIWADKLAEAQKITFIPSAHIGPYLVLLNKDEPHVMILYGARLPRELQTESPSTLGRSELLVRLNALADDARLRILELLTQESEICSQDIIARLELSQSSVSRHLSQLAATGYITERRRDVAKCYSLNAERVEETMKALNTFLKKKY